MRDYNHDMFGIWSGFTEAPCDKDDIRPLDKAVRRGCCTVATILIAIIIAFIIGSLTSCTTTEYVTVEKVRVDTTYITQHQRDSIWLHDSIMVSEKGDTIKIEKWHTKYVEKQVHDTLIQATHDTIPQPYPVIKEVEKKLSWWQKTEINAGRMLLLGIFISLIYFVVRNKLF